MAKQPKKSTTKKPAAAKKANTKPARAKKPAAAKEPATKVATVTKPAVTKTAAKKPAAAKKASTKSVKKPAGTTPVALLLTDATPVITSPSAGPVTASTSLTVTVDTDVTTVAYVVTMTDITNKATVVQTNNIPAPGASPFSTIIPGNKLPAGRTFKLKVKVDPADGSSPPNGTSEVTITT